MVYIVSGMWMQPYFISLSSLLTAIVSKSQMKQIQRTSSLLKTFYIFVQFVADDLLCISLIYSFLFTCFAFLLQKELFLLKRKKPTTFI